MRLTHSFGIAAPTRSRFHPVFAGLSVAASFLLCSVADAQISYLSANRSVAVSASGICDSFMADDSTMALGNYTQSLTRNADVGGDPSICQALSRGFASQMTNLLAGSINGEGRVESDAAFGGDASAASSLMVEFQLDSPSAYTLSGTVAGVFDEFFPNPSQTPGNARVVLSGTSGVIHEAQQTSSADFPFSFSGTLAPDTYTFAATAANSAYSDSSGFESFTFQLDIVPEPSAVVLLLSGLAALLGARQRTLRAGRKKWWPN